MTQCLRSSSLSTLALRVYGGGCFSGRETALLRNSSLGWPKRKHTQQSWNKVNRQRKTLSIVKPDVRLDSARSSWAESSARSKRSTQASFASSRTSYCSEPSCRNSGLSHTLQVHPGIPTPNESHHTISIEHEARDLSAVQAGQSSTNKLTKVAPDAIQARCPWCGCTFTRRHDFKKHARDFHLSRIFWQCLNLSCRERSGSERQAKLHPNRAGSANCRSLGSAKTELHCDRKHFGCPHCARYFGDAEEYLAHLALQCCPGKALRSAHQSLQVRALLQQPELIAHVKEHCLRLRGYAEAYKDLWWAWDRITMSEIIERLEFGLQQRVDSHYPGIAVSGLGDFLRDMLAPSPKSFFEAEIRDGQTSPTLQASKEKPLPPLPVSEALPTAEPQYHQESVFQQTRTFLQPWTHEPLQGSRYPYPSNVEEWRHQQPHYDPMIAGSFSDGSPRFGDFDTFQPFEWNHMAEDINVDPRQSNGFDGGRFGMI